MIFYPQYETLPRERLAVLQLDRLRTLVERIKQNVPLYRERLASVEPEDLASVEDNFLVTETGAEKLSPFPDGIVPT